MATRLCRPSADLKGLWQLLLPDTPFPACGTQENTDADARENARPANETRAAAEARRNFPRARRD
jgi:hypothetical protein